MKQMPYGGMPWMPWMPWMQQGEQPQQQYMPDLIVPARVHQAMDFLALISQKTQQRAAASENQIELIDGQKLCGEEENARDSACVCLAKYFDGKLQPDVWEKLRYEFMRKRVEMAGREGSILRCISCGSRPIPNPSCELCKGTGRIMVMSFGNNMVIMDEELGPEPVV